MQPWHKWGAALVLGATLGASHAQILVGQTAGFSGQVAAGVHKINLNNIYKILFSIQFFFTLLRR